MLLILWKVITPIFVLVALGFVVQHQIGLDLKTLTRLNFWVFVPAFLFVHIYKSELTGKELASIFTHFAVFFSASAILTWGLATALGLQDRLKRALTATVLFYNSGNYGIPVAQLAFPGTTFPLQVQAAIVMMQNISNFTLGLMLVAGGRGGRRRDTVAAVFKLPMIYVLVAAWGMRAFQVAPPEPVFQALTWLKNGLVPVAVITLGAQMASLKVPPLSPLLLLSITLRLVLSPLLGFLFVNMLNIHGVLAQTIVISCGFPTAVNAALLALEYDNEPQFAAAAVFYSTLVSAVTVSTVIYLTRTYMP